ncbi:MAG: hypothetical protein PVG93_05805, partial [Phycisphaerales bacterium]
SLRIVDFIEHPYPDFAGLNLMYETRLGLAKHRSPYDKPTDDVFSEKNCSLEGQIAGIADRIAYNCHDLEDGMRSRVIEAEQLANVKLFTNAQQRIKADAINDMTIRRIRTAKAIIDVLVSDCIEASRKVISSAGIKDIDQVYVRDDNLIVHSRTIETSLVQLEEFLMQNLYRHDSVRAEDKVKQWLSNLFNAICSKPDKMPSYYQKMIEQQALERVVCDYIAGMTDRYCLRMLEELSL